MAALFPRTLLPGRSAFSRLPGPLRQWQWQCSPIHHDTFPPTWRAAQSLACMSARPFHSSPSAAAKRSSIDLRVPKSTIQSRTSSPSSLPKKSPSPATFPSTPATSPTAVRHTARHTQPKEAPTPAFLPRADRPQSALIEKLAHASEPTVLYTAPSQAAFILVCLTSTLFLTAISVFTWNNYKPAVDQGHTFIAAVGLINCAIFFLLAIYFAVGPNALVKRLVAIPAKPSDNPSVVLKPRLRIEPVRLAFGKWPKPIEVDVDTVFSDRSIANEIANIAETRRPSALMQQFFPWVLKAWRAYLNMFARATRFTYIRAGHGNFKLDLDGCQALENGRVLDKLIRVDNEPANLFKRMFGN